MWTDQSEVTPGPPEPGLGRRHVVWCRSGDETGTSGGARPGDGRRVQEPTSSDRPVLPPTTLVPCVHDVPYFRTVRVTEVWS